MSKRQRIVFLAAFVAVLAVVGVFASGTLRQAAAMTVTLAFDSIRVHEPNANSQPRDVVGLIYGLSEVDGRGNVTNLTERRMFFRVKPGAMLHDIPAAALQMREDRNLRLSFVLVHDNAPYEMASLHPANVADCRNRVLVDLIQFSNVGAGANCGVRLIFGMTPHESWLAQPVDRTFSPNWMRAVRSVEDHVQLDAQMTVNDLAYDINYTLRLQGPADDESQAAAKLLVD